MFRVLDVSTSGFYAWLVRKPSKRARRDAELIEKIKRIHAESRGTYGAPRIHAELVHDGDRVGIKRVERLMRQAGLEGVSRRKKRKTTRRDADARPSLDLVQRDFTADGPDKLWVADITYVPAWAGFLYLAVVLDAWSRRIVGWCMENHLRTALVLDALEMAVWQRRPDGVIHHSDQGCQYTSIAFGLRCREEAFVPRWDRSAMRTTTRCARASSPRSNASFSIAADSRAKPRPRWPFSTLSKAGTTPDVVIRASAIIHPCTTRGSFTRKLRSLIERCPPNRGNSRSIRRTCFDPANDDR
jgi:transposase InsO family protein